MREALKILPFILFAGVSLFTLSSYSQDDNIEIQDDQYDLSLEKKVARDLEKIRKKNKASDSDIKKFIKKHNVKLNDDDISEIENAQPINAAAKTQQLDAIGDDDLETEINSTVKALGGMQMEPEAQKKLMEKIKKGELTPADLALGKGDDTATGGMGGGSIMSEKGMMAMVDQLQKNNPFAKMSRKELFAMIDERVKGTKAEKLVNSCQKCKDFFVDYMRHPKALGSFMGIIKKKDDLKMYGAAVVGMFILSLIINFVVLRKLNFIIKFFARIVVTFSAFVGNIYLLYFFFPKELDPTVEVIKKTFF